MSKKKMWTEDEIEEIVHNVAWDNVKLHRRKSLSHNDWIGLIIGFAIVFSYFSFFTLVGNTDPRLDALESQHSNMSALFEELGWEYRCAEWENLTVYRFRFSYDCGDDDYCEGGVWATWGNVKETFEEIKDEPNLKIWLIEKTKDKGECIDWTWLPPEVQEV